MICIHILVCCISLYLLPKYDFAIADRAAFHIFFDPAQLYVAAFVVLAFVPVSALFVFSSFSFGYFVGFYFYTMVLGYLWLNCFTDLNYDHRLAGLSAGASAITFLWPALFGISPVRQRFVLSEMAFDRLLNLILLFAAGTIALGAIYNFRFVAIENIYDFRNKLESPKLLNYATGLVSGTLLPFAFAGFATRKTYGRAVATLLLLLFLYPIMLSKVALFTPFWLIGIFLLSRLFEARIVVVLSLLGPVLAVLVLVYLFDAKAALYLSIVNFRMIAVPSVAIDVYNDFFSRHDFTYFCQISVLKTIMHCPYQEPLGTVMERAYKLGNFNASLFATEGIASVGTLLAPVAVLACGLVIAIGNRLSAGLPAGFILISGAIMPQLLLNVSLTIVLLTHGAGVLFVLWYLTPRSIFKQGPPANFTEALDGRHAGRPPVFRIVRLGVGKS